MSRDQSATIRAAAIQGERAADVLPLDQLSRAAVSAAGSKAANLGELLRAGFPVPRGFVVTTAAFERFMASNGLRGDATEVDITTTPLPPELVAALRRAADLLGEVPLAVRSSGVAEDLADASFAGQYETVLGVRGPEQLIDAIRRCWASCFNARVSAYRAARPDVEPAALASSPASPADGPPPAMAVLVQRLVEPDAAGVAFTANPITGDRQETVVSAVRGLGERLVSGQASPDEWLVRGDEAVCRAAPEGAIGAEQARAVAALARRVEAHFGTPQDVEWASQGGQVFLLQARPITALPEFITPVPVPVVPPTEGFWEREATHYPEPLSPLFRGWIPSLDDAFRATFAEIGLLADGLEHREVGGWVYSRVAPLGGKEPPAMPPWLASLVLPVMARLVPDLRARVQTCVAAVRDDLFGRWAEQWYAEWKPAQIEAIQRLRAVDLETLSDEGLVEHLDALHTFGADSMKIHFKLTGPSALLFGELVMTCQELLSWDEGKVMDLVCGLSTMSTEPSRRLATLVELARDNPALIELLQQPETAAARLWTVDPAFARAFESYQDDYGCRALRYELTEPTVAECPELVLGLVRDQLRRPYDPDEDAARQAERRAAVEAEALAQLDGRSEARARFVRALARARLVYPLREENEFYTISAPLAVRRYAALEAGRRLAAKGVIAGRDDVFFLEIKELDHALLNGGDRKQVVDGRKGERAWVKAHPGVPAYGKRPAPPPPLGRLPAEVQAVMGSFTWTLEHIFAPEANGRRHAADATRLEGIPAAAGRYTGRVRVILSESEFGKIRAGDVLVCPITSPVWSVLFSSVGALITDTGGVLSHSAIIAREYGIPAVVATGNATEVLRDDQLVTVDGTTGAVEVVS